MAFWIARIYVRRLNEFQKIIDVQKLTPLIMVVPFAEYIAGILIATIIMIPMAMAFSIRMTVVLKFLEVKIILDAQKIQMMILMGVALLTRMTVVQMSYDRKKIFDVQKIVIMMGFLTLLTSVHKFRENHIGRVAPIQKFIITFHTMCVF